MALVASDPSASVAATINYDRTWLKDPIDPVNNRSIYLEGTALESSTDEDQGVFTALEREDPVVVSGTIHDEQVSLSLYVATQAEYEALIALRKLQRVLLLQTTMENWYGRFGSRWQIQRAGTGAKYRRISTTWIETAAP